MDQLSPFLLDSVLLLQRFTTFVYNEYRLRIDHKQRFEVSFFFCCSNDIRQLPLLLASITQLHCS